MGTLKNSLSALIIAVGIIILGLCLRSGINNIAFNDRAVVVRGLATRDVKADKVTWPIVTKTIGNDLPSLYDQINNTNNIIVKFLTENGIPESEISINEPNVWDKDAQQYSNNDSPNRYMITSVLTVSSSNVDKVNSLIKRQAELLKQGIGLVSDYEYHTKYEFTGLNDIKPEMIVEATKNARQAAQKFAEDSDSKLGKIKTAQQGQFSIDDRDEYTPYIKTVRVVNSITYYLED
jgi:hypothetical protein